MKEILVQVACLLALGSGALSSVADSQFFFLEHRKLPRQFHNTDFIFMQHSRLCVTLWCNWRLHTHPFESVMSGVTSTLLDGVSYADYWVKSGAVLQYFTMSGHGYISTDLIKYEIGVGSQTLLQTFWKWKMSDQPN